MGLEMRMLRVSGGQGMKGDGPRVLRMHSAHQTLMRLMSAVADIGIAAVTHDLDAVAAPALVGEVAK